MRLKRMTFFEMLLPATFLLFVGKGTTFIDVLKPSVLQWPIFFILVTYLILNKNFWIYCNQIIVAILLIYLTWCVFTTFWSSLPMMSFGKSSMFALTIVTVIASGQLWVLKFGYEKSFEILVGITVITLISGLLGLHTVNAYNDNGFVTMYSGLSGNPNNFGLLCAIVSPLILWRMYKTWGKRWSCIFWGLLLIIDVRALLMSHSRSTTVIFCCVLYAFILALSNSKKLIVLFSTIFLFIILAMIMPMSTLQTSIARYIVKSNHVVKSTSDQLLLSRKQVWQKSYQQAIKGGMFGGGFEVTIGDDDYNLTSKHKFYGREKGNSQLSILEETGVVGLILYLIVIIFLYMYACTYYRQLRGDKKVAMGLVLGIITGLLVESLVEAWWDSLGPEVIVFWLFVGVAFGMIYLQKREKLIRT